jgi:hypothetical protein
MDDDPPVLVLGQVPDRTMNGTDLVLEVTVSDNIGVRSVALVYSIGGGASRETVMKGGGEHSFVLSVPRGAEGEVVCHFTAGDLAGNRVETETMRIGIDNPPPEVGVLGTFQVTEGETAHLDLQGTISDPNDPLLDLTVSTDDVNVTVDGLSLIVLYEVWVPPHDVRLLVSDGQAVTEAFLHVIVLDTNDPPGTPRILSPGTNSTWRLGEGIPLDVEYWDPDLPEGQLLEIVWTSDVSGEIARYDSRGPATHVVDDLDAGDHVITVTVSDGEFEASSSVDLTVEEGPMWGLGLPVFGLLVLVIVTALVLAFLVLRARGGSGGTTVDGEPGPHGDTNGDRDDPDRAGDDGPGS